MCRISVVLFHTTHCAACKRRGQTKVFPLLLIPLLFLAAVRRFPAESYTDMPLLPAYARLDVSFCGTMREIFCEPEDVFHRMQNADIYILVSRHKRNVRVAF